MFFSLSEDFFNYYIFISKIPMVLFYLCLLQCPILTLSFFLNFTYLNIVNILPCSGWAAVTEYHRLGSLNNRNLLSHSSGKWKSEIRVQALGHWWKSTSGLEDSHLLPVCSHGLSSVHGIEREIDLSSVSFYKNTNLIRSGLPPLWPRLTLITWWQRSHLQI